MKSSAQSYRPSSTYFTERQRKCAWMSRHIALNSKKKVCDFRYFLFTFSIKKREVDSKTDKLSESSKVSQFYGRIKIRRSTGVVLCHLNLSGQHNSAENNFIVQQSRKSSIFGTVEHFFIFVTVVLRHC